jgi:FdhD protein
MSAGSITHTITRINASQSEQAIDELAVEEPLEIILQHGPAANQKQQSISVTMRTPGTDKELAIGFLFTEGIIRTPAEIKMIIAEASGPNTVLVILNEGIIPALPESARNFYTTSSCGVCGKASMEAIRTVSVFPKTTDEIRIPSSLFYALPLELRRRQDIFTATGGLHASALFDLSGQLLSLHEDVGRHNALDKLIGEAFLRNQLPLSSSILFLSGRASFELVQKAFMAGIKMISAVGAPSSLAVSFAEDAGITLIGFLRDARFNIYSCAQRIK